MKGSSSILNSKEPFFEELMPTEERARIPRNIGNAKAQSPAIDTPSTDTVPAAKAQRIVISFPQAVPMASNLKRRMIVSESEDEEDEEDDEDEEFDRALTESRAEYEALGMTKEKLSRRSTANTSPFSSKETSRSVGRSRSRAAADAARRRVTMSYEDSSQLLDMDVRDDNKNNSRIGTRSSGRVTSNVYNGGQKSRSGTSKKPRINSSRDTNVAQRSLGYYFVNQNYLDEAGNILIVGEDDPPKDEEEEETLPVRILDDFTVYNLLESNGRGGFKIAGLESYYVEGYDLRASGKVKPESVDNNGGADQIISEDDESGDELEEEQSINISTIFYVQLTMDPTTKEDIVWIRTQFAFYRLEQPSAMYATCFSKTMKQRLIPYDDDDTMETSEYEDDVSDDTEDSSDGASTRSAVKKNTKDKASIKRKKASKSRSKIPSTNGRAAAEPCVTPLIASLSGDLFSRQLNVASHEVDDAAQALLEDEQELSRVVKDFTFETDWIGGAIGKNGERTYYSGARVDGVNLTAGDCIYVRNDSPEPWLAKIMYFFELEKCKYYHIRYFSRGSETILMETAGAREIFLLDNCGDAELVTVMGKCPVTFVGDAEEIPSKDYYYRFWYDSKHLWTFEDAIGHEALTEANIALCQQYEPCVSCSRSIQETLDDVSPTIIHRGLDAISSFRYRKQEYHERDFVYLVNSYEVDGIMIPIPNCMDTNPYNIGQILRIHSSQEGDQIDITVEVRLFERYDNFLDQNPILSCRGNRIQKPVFKDHRRLVLTNNIQKFTIDSLEGTCRVRFITETDDYNLEAQKALGEYKDQADAFYYKDYLIPQSEYSGDGTLEGYTLKARLIPTVAQKQSAKKGGCDIECPASRRQRLARISDCGTIVVENETTVIQRPRPCRICEEEWRTQSDNQTEFLANVRKLRALDIFSGCGGLSLGLKESNVVETRYSIEFMTSAAQTYRHNFPGATVYNDDANILLSRAINQINGKNVQPRNDFAGNPLPAMPLPEDVDLIYCGPPCQGFSRMNMFQKADDLKNSLIATAMSYVDIYKPQYFLLENVRGMLSFRLGKVKVRNKWEGGIHMGVVKFVVRCLTAMGYQCRFGLMQAGHHNLPQSRRRLFIWGAKLGSSLPDFPKPLTCFPYNEGLKISPPPGLNDHSPFSYQRTRVTQAPDPAVTVRDAIGDLPGFEYINPHLQYEEMEGEKKERLQEERWAFREARRLRRRKAKQLQRMVERYGIEFNESDVDGYLSYTDESENEREREEERRAEAKEMNGKATIVPGRPYYPLLDGRAPASGVGYTVHDDQAYDSADGGLRGKYSSRPQSEYQRRMRARTGKAVMNHVVRTFNDMNLERICRVAMRPEADHRSLPKLLKPWCLSSPDSAASRNNDWAGLFGRLDFEGQFQTAVTGMQPMGKQGKVIHPNQSRVLSVRESARVQGFPDDFEFFSATNDVKWMYTQIGNAVPPPLAKALGTKLRDAMMLNNSTKGKGKKNI
ncbi:DNA (cytosine-5)-methyltransferase 1 [Mortierella sp. AD010]|nr:DNA (cytosine-5)-methyltransferase 1 [Mortierella sp. AD010]